MWCTFHSGHRSFGLVFQSHQIEGSLAPKPLTFDKNLWHQKPKCTLLRMPGSMRGTMGKNRKIANVVISWCLLSWFEFLNLSWTVNTLTKSLNQYIIVIVLVVVIVINLGWQLDGLDATNTTTTYVTKARGKMLVWCVGVWCVGVWCVGVCGVVQ